MSNDPKVRRVLELCGRLGPELADLTRPAEALQAITDRCLTSIDGAAAAGITRAREDGFETVAPTGELVARVDAIQYELGSGPCVDAVRNDAVFRTGDLRHDGRWPEFGVRAAQETGVQSMLSYRMFFEDDDDVAGLNVYSTEADAFDDDAHLAGLALSTYGALAVTAARQRDRIVNLERALASNREIGVAIGILMALHRLTRQQAFDLLRVVSQSRQRKLYDVARGVAESGSLEVG